MTQITHVIETKVLYILVYTYFKCGSKTNYKLHIAIEIAILSPEYSDNNRTVLCLTHDKCMNEHKTHILTNKYQDIHCGNFKYCFKIWRIQLVTLELATVMF